MLWKKPKMKCLSCIFDAAAALFLVVSIDFMVSQILCVCYRTSFARQWRPYIISDPTNFKWGGSGNCQFQNDQHNELRLMHTQFQSNRLIFQCNLILWFFLIRNLRLFMKNLETKKYQYYSFQFIATEYRWYKTLTIPPSNRYTNNKERR